MKKIIDILYTWEDEDRKEALNLERKTRYTKIMVILAVLVLSIFFLRGIARADIINEPNIAGYSLNQWCYAIGKAENSKKHPYGILAHYRHTTPLQACRNTVLHKWRNYQASGERKRFLAYIANAYCPIGGKNDNGNCKYWSINVERLLKRG